MSNLAASELLGPMLLVHSGQSMAACLEQAIADPAQALCWTVALSQALAQAHTTYLNLPVDFTAGHAGNLPVSVTGVVAPWRDGGTQPAGAIVILHDNAQYRHLAELRNRFFSVISHELGSPVTNIAAAADLLAQQLETAPLAQQRLVHIVQDESARFRRMLGQFLSTSPVQTGTLRPARNVVTLRPLLQRVLQTFEVRATGHRLVLQVPPTLPFVEGDADRIQEVLCNLIDNAARYSPPDTPIVLAAEEWPGEVLLSVTDQGRGLPVGEEERVFEPFYRGSPQDQEGTGVGLYIAKTLVRAMGGELWYERQPGRGTRFCLTLGRVHGLEAGEGGDEGGSQDPDRRG